MKNLWKKVLSRLPDKISTQNIKTWIEPIRPVEMDSSTFRVEVPNKFIKDWIKDNYRQIISETIFEVTGNQLKLEININKNIKKSAEPENQVKSKEIIEKTEKPKLDIPKEEMEFSNLNPSYTFDSFVSGPSNQFAHAAALAVSNNPATTYNPLFIYGGVGLGKTHIIHAIGNEILKTDKSMKVCYYSSEKFTNELINSLRHAKMDDFRNKFRSIDILLIDDIQFIAGKKKYPRRIFSYL